MNKRKFIKTAFAKALGIHAMKSYSAPNENHIAVKPEQFGAVGDGVADDTESMNEMIEYVNNLKNENATMIMNNKYRIKANRTKDEKNYIYNGLNQITKNNVSIESSGGVIIIDETIDFQRITKGGDEFDLFASGIRVKGERFKINGLTIDGNIRNRKVRKPPIERGYGGLEFGLWMEGKDWSIENVTVKDWGTDCVLIQKSGKTTESTIHGGLRNALSIVNKGQEKIEVEVSKCVITNASQYDAGIVNAPGSGIHLEGKGDVYIKIIQTKFKNSRVSDLTVSSGGVGGEIKKCSFTSKIRFRNTRQGCSGAYIFDNCIYGDKVKIELQKTRNKLELIFKPKKD